MKNNDSPRRKYKNWLAAPIVAGLLLGFFLLNLGSIRFKSLTTDEPKHYRYGMNILNLNSDRFDDSKMPFSALNALPAKIADFIPVGFIRHTLQKEITARMVTMLFSVLIALLVFLWSKTRYGLLPAFLSLLLYILDPNIIAHSRLITTDIYAAGMITLTIYTFWLFSNNRNWKYATLSAVMLGISQLAKYTSAYLYPILALIVLARDTPEWLAILREKDWQKARLNLANGTKHLAFFLVVSVLIINIGFLFNKSFTPLKDYNFRSDLFKSTQSELSAIGAFPVPVPYPYLEGLDWVLARERTGAGYGRLYMFGNLRKGQNFKGYFIFASLLKTPIATQIIILLGIAVYLWKRKFDGFRENELFFAIPVIFFFLYFNFIFRAQIGIRFYLVIFPLLYVFCGSLLRDWQIVRRQKKIALGVLLGYLAASVLLAYPNYIPYFNEIVWHQKDAYKYLADSNLDWEQSRWLRDQYLKAHPEIHYEPDQPRTGLIMVSPNKLVGVDGVKNRFLWLRKYFEPVDVIHDVYLLFHVTEKEYNRTIRKHIDPHSLL